MPQRDQHPSPATRDPAPPADHGVPLDDLTPHAVLTAYAHAVPGAEPSMDDYLAQIARGGLPVLVVAGSMILFGMVGFRAAQRSGRSRVEVRECDGCDALCETELALRAAQLHLGAVIRRTAPSPFDARLVTARLYQAWAGAVVRRPPRKRTAEVRREREATRQRMIREAFGRAQRSLERDLVLLHLRPALQDAVRLGRLPERDVETVARLEPEQQRRLADALARGTPYSEARDEILGPPDGCHKSMQGARRAIGTAIRTFAREARGREDCFALRADEYPDAQYAHGLLSNWLGVPPPAQSVEAAVEQIADEVRGRPHRRTDSTATRGGRGAAGGTP